MANRKGDVLRKPGRGRMYVQSTGPDFTGSGFKLTVPATIARMVGPDRLFAVELTEEGILYRFVEGGEPIRLPSWLTR